MIQQLPRAGQKAFTALCEPVELELGATVYEAGDTTSHVYFPLGAFVSLISCPPGLPGIEVGMVGFEGMVGTQLVLGQPKAPLQATVQGAGSALRMSAQEFQRQLGLSPTLDRILRRYLAVLMKQFATAAPCLRFHEITQRLARWLLMSHDRAGRDEFKSTHQFLSFMLGVRRAGVTEAAGELQKQGAIHYERGMVTVLDRALLEKASCSCYAADVGDYEEAMAASL